MKPCYKLTSFNKTTNTFKAVSKNCIMEGSETTEVSIPAKPVTEVIVTHKHHWNQEETLVRGIYEYLHHFNILKFQFDMDLHEKKLRLMCLPL